MRFKAIIWRVTFIVLGAVIVFLCMMAARNYWGDYYHLRATRGVHTEEFFVETMQKAIDYDRAHGYSDIMLARIFLNRHDLVKAEEYQKQGMKSFSSARTYAQMGLICELAGRPDEAKTWYDKALRMNPKNSDCLERLMVLAFNSGNSDRVIEYADRLNDLDMNNVNGYYLRGKSLEKKGDINGALQNYTNISTIMSRVKKLDTTPVFEKQELEQTIIKLSAAGK